MHIKVEKYSSRQHPVFVTVMRVEDFVATEHILSQ